MKSDTFSWIIPARAGFTCAAEVGARGEPDHPRSRGVYRHEKQFSGTISGSSPLARGLPKMKSDTFSLARIIPARAGFTGFYGGVGGAPMDHPRSRGVYPTTSGQVGGEAGSSPLARGLPWSRTRKVSGAGIIPARAGFT